ncbi:MAG TPA: glutamyl-tRNA reductase [Micromonosporaceae bacterium]|jgi:glutamyl-tRNA reductase
MNLLVVGVSHRTASVSVLERLAASAQDAPLLLTDLMSQPYVGEAMVLSTCNRVEVYAGVTAFHGGLADIAGILAARLGSSAADLAPYMYVHFDADAARHAFRVATGLDSMVVGEPQILGQLRDAYGLAIERDTAGRLIHELMQQALRVGKRAHAETEIDHAGQNVTSAALAVAQAALPQGLAGASALVIGAGSMGALALANLRRAGVGSILVTNRDPARSERLAALHGATAVPYAELADAVSRVDLVISATAASGHVLTANQITGPVVILDLAVPRDVSPLVADLPGVTLIDMELLAATLRADKIDNGLASGEEAVESIVDAEVDAFRTMLRGATVAPTVAALRARADEVVATELHRLGDRRVAFTDEQRAEVAQTVHRVVQRLLHSPTVRIRELAAGPGGDRYAEVLRELFDLDVPPSAETIADVPDDACDSGDAS